MGASDFSKLPHIGESLRRKEDYRFLTGAGQYTDDVVLAAQSHAVFVRSPHAHAKINRINVDAAQAAPDAAAAPAVAASPSCLLWSSAPSVSAGFVHARLA